MFLKTIISIFVLLQALTEAYGQIDSISLKDIYRKEVIYLGGNKYIKNYTAYPIKNLKNEFEPNTEGFEQYRLFLSDQHKSRLYAGFGLTFIVLGIIVGRNEPDLGYGLILGSIVPTGISFSLKLKADKKMKKAVWLRNRDVLLKHY